ncbi:MAG TPA: hypothetical protein VMT36_04005 [Candidatus Saccharimonadia bacterium]|nr:hypothetical protein [Candidatus Saccharimonadia bacterium]
MTGASPSPSDGGTFGRGPLVGARSLRAAGVAGIVFAVLFTASLLLLLGRQPANASLAVLAAWITDSEQRWFIGLQMIPFAGIAFLWFLATIRNRIGRREDQFLATVFIGSGLLFVAMMFVGGAAAGAAVTLKSLTGTTIDPDAATIGRGIAYALYFIYGLKMAAVFILVSSTIGLRSGALPRWFCLLGYPTAIALLVVVFVSEYVVLVFPVWVAITSLILIFGRDPLAAGTGGSEADSNGHEG